MKRISILFLTFFLAHFFTYSQETLSSLNDWQEITDELQMSDKLLLLVFLDNNYNENFSDLIKPEILDEVVERFVCCKIDINDSLGIILSKKFRIDETPVLLAFNSSGEYIERYSYPEANSLIMKRFLNENIEDSKTKEYHYNSTDLNINYPSFYDEYFNQNSKERKHPTDSIVNSYLDDQEDLYSEINWSVIRVCEPDKYRNFVIRNVDEYYNRYGAGELSRFLIPHALDYLEKFIEFSKIEYYDSAYLIANYCLFPDIVKTSIDSYYFEEVENWKDFVETLETLIPWLTYDGINEACWTIYENVNDKTILNKARELMKPVIKNDPSWWNLDTYAALLYKTENFEEALVYADKAIDTAIINKVSDFVSTSNLKERILEQLYGQEYIQEVNEYLEDVLYGKWIAHCPFERISVASTALSSLCPTIINNDSTILTTDLLELEICDNFISFFTYDSILSEDASEYVPRSHKTSIPFDFGYNNNEIKFILFEKGYIFKVIFLGPYADYGIILKENDGSIVYLERIPSRNFYHFLEKY